MTTLASVRSPSIPSIAKPSERVRAADMQRALAVVRKLDNVIWVRQVGLDTLHVKLRRGIPEQEVRLPVKRINPEIKVRFF